MKNIAKQKRIIIFMMAVFALVLGVFSMSIFGIGSASATQSTDFDSFCSAIDAMIEYNERQNELQKESLSLLKIGSESEEGEADEEEISTNRLIINSNSALSSCGALAKAEYKDVHIFQYNTAQEAQKAYDYYSSLDCVDGLMYDTPISAEDFEIESESTSYKSWGASFLGYSEYMATITESSTSLKEVVVAVLDSGINTSHELFRDRILLDYGMNFTTEVSESAYDFEDLNGHGTHVAGIIANATPACVKILPLKVLNSNGDGYVSYITKAINQVQIYLTTTDLDIRLMNMSIGVKQSSTAEGEVSAKNSALTNGIKNAYNKGVLSIVSAGNERTDTTYCTPANIDCAVTVSALYKYTKTYPSKTETLLFDSSYSNYGSHVDFSAPGTSIESAGISSSNSYVSMTGTSMAAPHVTACYALVLTNENYNAYTCEEINQLMQENAVDLGTSGRDDYYGYGCISVANIGILNSGYVTFTRSDGETDFDAETSFDLSLDYDMSNLPSDYSCEIYYSTNENATSIDKTSDTLYSSSSPIEISATTKVTAVAFVYTGAGTLIQRSFLTSKIYYFDNIDLASNFTLSQGSSSAEVVITKYNGELTTLNVPMWLGGKIVRGVNYRAFNSSKVEVLYLPSTVSTIYSSAFYNNTTIKEIYCSSTDVAVGASAFRYSSIENYDVEYTTSV